MMQLKNRIQLVLLLSAIYLVPSMASAAKFDFYFGAFDLSAETNENDGNVSGLGSYKMGYYLPALINFEFGIGYSLILSNTFGGDAAFGFEAEAAWFPFTQTTPIKVQSDKSFIRISPLWRPFVYAGYIVRQFQSVETQYNGFSLGLGAERALTYDFDAKFLVRYITLAGPNESEATEIDVLAGITFDF
jgi:hypothetical protein